METDLELITLLKTRIAASKRSQKKIADQAGIHPSQLSQVLRGTKRLSRDRLLALGSVLGIPDAELLTAAGLEVGATATRIGLSSPYSGDAKVRVVTDPRFIDSALFMWMCSTQPFLRHGVTLDLKRADWALVPEQFVDTAAVVGFYNRNYEGDDADYPFPREILRNVHYWADLSFYRGYAVLARKRDLLRPDAFSVHPVAEPNVIRGALAELESLSNSGSQQPRAYWTSSVTDRRIITIGADTRWRLTQSPVFGTAFQKLPIKAIGDPEAAIKSFLGGLGSLFVGGLPQRLLAESTGEHVAILTSEDDPFLFSINSLVCSQRIMGSSLLYWLEALWAETIDRMRRDRAFRQDVAHECRNLLRAFDLDPDQSSLHVEYFDKVFGENGEQYESFVTHSSQLTSEFLAITSRMLRAIPSGQALPSLERSMRLAFGLEATDMTI